MNVPKDLVDQIARGNGIVFDGAGLSQAAGLPGWVDLLRQMLDWSEKHGKELTDRDELKRYIDNGELLLVAEEMRERLGKDDFRRFMAEIFRKPGLKPTAPQTLLPQIPFVAALTSNFETLLESAYTISRGAAPHVFTHADYPELSAALRSGEFYVLKVHGTIDRIQTIVLGRSDYRDVMHANPPYPVVSRILADHDTPHGILFSKERLNRDATEGEASWTNRHNCGRGGCRC